MPELIEVEAYRALAAGAVGRTISGVPVVDDLGRRRDPGAMAMRTELVGATVTRAHRIGKLLLLETDGPTLGLRFGMTGRLLVDGRAGVGRLEYGGHGDDERWDRYVVAFADGGDMRLRDPRRLGSVELDPDTSLLGPDAAAITGPQLAGALAGSAAPLKARLLDQRRVAGLGNLLVDEILWRHGLDPELPAGTIDRAGAQRLAGTVRRTVALLTRRGGSHTGELQAERHRRGTCPRDGAPLDRLTVGGRTTYRCSVHQRTTGP